MGARPLRGLTRRHAGPAPRLRPGPFLVGALLLLAAASAAAQQPPVRRPRPPPPDTVAPRPDTLPPRPDTAAAPLPDTLPPPVDTAAAATPPDTLLPPPAELQRFPEPVMAGWGDAVWEWDRAALLREATFSLNDLLERIPGVIPVRSGYLGQPESASAFGTTGGRLEVVLDGYTLDPLQAAVLDLARLELVQLRRVRVERRMDLLRLELESLAPSDARSYTLIEAATGQPSADLLRGLFLAPRLLGGPFAAALERLDSDGGRRREPATAFAGWLKWGLIGKRHGVQLELRRTSIERLEAGAMRVDGRRQDWVVRARTSALAGLLAEVYAGRSSLDDQPRDSTPIEAASTQLGLRARYDARSFWGRATLRGRSHRGLPRLELELAAGGALPGRLALLGTLHWADWQEGEGAATGRLAASAGPFRGLRLLGEIAGGDRGVPFLRAAGTPPADTTPGEMRAPVLTDRSGVRLGAEFERGRLRLGVAALQLEADSVPTFRLAFDRAGRLFPAGDVRGFELHARLPAPWRPLSLEAWYTVWTEGPLSLYMPAEAWRASLVYHDLPLAGGNLEVLARLESRGRGEMRVPSAGAGRDVVPDFATLDFYLQIRVLDVRVFLRWDNITSRRDLQDLPGRTFPGQRAFYGVKWEFYN
ncbi:MAG: hypothetical protein HY703_07415 [Gemmatimonadetes bacterium]|nr:hypothetical protein [Gemmatimonadota bacterium]